MDTFLLWDRGPTRRYTGSRIRTIIICGTYLYGVLPDVRPPIKIENEVREVEGSKRTMSTRDTETSTTTTKYLVLTESTKRVFICTHFLRSTLTNPPLESFVTIPSPLHSTPFLPFSSFSHFLHNSSYVSDTLLLRVRGTSGVLSGDSTRWTPRFFNPVNRRLRMGGDRLPRRVSK